MKRMPAEKKSLRQKPLTRSVWWALFLLATYVMSLWFQTFKAFTLVPSWQNALLWLGVMLVLVLLVLLLAYDSYVQEKANARVQKPVQLFETLYRKRFLIRKDLQQKEFMK